MTEPNLAGQGEWARLVKDARAEDNTPLPLLAPAPPERRRRILLPVLLVLSLGALALHLVGPLNPWPPAPTSTELSAGRLAAMNLAASAIHDYAGFHGYYPAKLADVLPQMTGIEYVSSADGFELRAVGGDGKAIVVTGK